MNFAKTLRAYGARLLTDPFGHKQRLFEYLDTTRSQETRFFAKSGSIALEDVFPWDMLSAEMGSFRARKWVPRSEVDVRPGSTVGHFGMRTAYSASGESVGIQSELHRIPPLTRTISYSVDLAFDARDLRGIGASKADLKRFRTIDEFITSVRPQWVENSTQAALEAVAEQVGEVPTRSGDRVTRYGWEEGVWFENTDGSHRVAALSVLARRLGVPTALGFPAREVLLHEAGLQALHETWSVYMVNAKHGSASTLSSHLERAGVRWTALSLSVGERDVEVLFFDRNDRVASEAADLFEKAGYTEVGQHLLDAYERQCEAYVPQPIPAHSIGDQECDRSDVCR